MVAEMLFHRLATHVETYRAALGRAPLFADVTPDVLRAHLASAYPFDRPRSVDEVFEDVTRMFWDWAEHAGNPRHFGLFRPGVDATAVVAEALVALHDPNLATWNFSPAAAEIERHVLKTLAAPLGQDVDQGAAHFTSGGQESNHTAVLVALARHFPQCGAGGLRALSAQPVFYVSEEGHHSLDKVAQASGLGRGALRAIPTDARLRMDLEALRARVRADRGRGFAPFLVVGTAGTTSAGVVDPLRELADVCAEEQLWFHVDAAWGGAAVLSERLRPAVAGIERADSVTWDAHKWLSVPVAAGMFFTRHRAPVEGAFGVDAAYVPPRRPGASDPLSGSLQWSRRCMGLKVFMVLAEHGVAGIARRLEHQAAMADVLRGRLRTIGWSLVNETPLPVVCFTHPRFDVASQGPAFVQRLAREGVAWISVTRLRRSLPALRACVTNVDTQSTDLEPLVEALAAAVR
jgi:glutamate/tyrosine decarboxylase-like PLP-dependent enzyme